MPLIYLLQRRNSWNIHHVTVPDKMQQILSAKELHTVPSYSAPHVCLGKKEIETLMLQPKLSLGSEGLGEMDKEWTSSFQLSLSAASSPGEAALFKFCSNVLLRQPTGMSWRKIMFTRFLYFLCQTGLGFGGWLEERNRSQGAQEVQATKAN